MTKKKKTDIELKSAVRLVHPMHTVLVSCVGKVGEHAHKPNIITLAWAMPTSINPPMVAISVSPRRHSHALIAESREFVVNIPTMQLLEQVMFCGEHSGRKRDKFKETGLTPLKGKKVKAPLIKECIAHLECKLYGQFTTGDHTIFVGEIVAAQADKEAFTNSYDLERARMIFHLNGDKFATLKPDVSRPKARTRSSHRA
jgi:flavin reductase (DIM6/NTAB) family NADH-FMN oxidoreductase RutF